VITDERRGAVAQSEKLPAPVVTSPSTLMTDHHHKGVADGPMPRTRADRG
jgi:hypothetical protein